MWRQASLGEGVTPLVGIEKNRSAVAAVKAHAQGVTVQTLLLGSNRTGCEILDEIAWATGGSLVSVSDPAMLPEAFLNLRTTGVDSVTLSVNGSEPVLARLVDILEVAVFAADLGTD